MMMEGDLDEEREKREALRQLIAESQYDITHGQETTPKSADSITRIRSR